MKLDEFLGKNASNDVSALLSAVAESSIRVWEGIPFTTGLLSDVNPSGEKQKALDVFSNDVFVKALVASGSAREVASEELARPVPGGGGVSVAMDPLDGSSNIETNNPLGSIFGFYGERLPCSGRALTAAAYLTYGGMLTLTVSLGKGVHRFVAVRHGSLFSFELLASGLTIPERPEVYGIGGQSRDWTPAVQRFVQSLEGRGMRVRYCGTFVGDYNQVLARGGVFAYPELRDKPEGKLRVLYETAPMAYITEQAGGYSTDGRRNILDIRPSSLAGRAPAYLGSAPLVRELEQLVSAER